MSKVQKVLLIIGIILVLGGIGFLSYGYIKKLTMEVKNPIATMEIQDYGTVKIELYPDKAPNTVTNFIRLANRGFYDGKTFHRTIPDFMIQGGDPNGDGTGTPKLSNIKDNVENDKDYNIPGEFIANGYSKNNLKHEKGIISMARSDYSSLSSSLTTQGYNSAGSQFFIMTNDNTSLDGLYTAFGKVIEGLDVIDKVANVEVVTRDETASEGVNKPVNPPVITSLKVETFGIDYGEPTTVDPFDYYSWMMQQYGGGSTAQ